MDTWEFVLVSLSAGFTNGGYGGLFWTLVGTVLCCSTIVASLAELETMAPTSGGQYHWVSEFAPEEYQRFLSYAVGWMSSLGWIASVASSVFVCTTMIQAMIELGEPDFAFPNWQYTLIMIAFSVLTIFFNTWGAPYLPLIETLSLSGHLGGFLVVIIPLLVLCPKNSASEAFTSVVNSGGWSSKGTACLLSQVTVLYCNLESDSAVHISEKVADAGFVVPRVMWWSYVMSVLLGIFILITMLLCIYPLDAMLDAVLDSDAPYLQSFTNTRSQDVALTG
ncbi:hypothetical protein Vi05172_g11065 [Venturia inaequalis]|nr:hypothetical protein Vi05172_g11065 [Venturia inaequalis]